MSSKYSSIAIFDLSPNERVAISTISISSEEVSLSGAWVFPTDQVQDISLVLSGRLAIPLSDAASKKFSESIFQFKTVSLDDFFLEAKRDAKAGLESFDSYKNEDLKKRKNLVSPIFFDWQDAPDLRQSSSYLETQGLLQGYEGTSPEMENVLSAARVVKFLIERWQSDENARSGRKYVDGQQAEMTILPTAWLN